MSTITDAFVVLGVAIAGVSFISYAIDKIPENARKSALKNSYNFALMNYADEDSNRVVSENEQKKFLARLAYERRLFYIEGQGNPSEGEVPFFIPERQLTTQELTDLLRNYNPE